MSQERSFEVQVITDVGLRLLCFFVSVVEMLFFSIQAVCVVVLVHAHVLDTALNNIHLLVYHQQFAVCWLRGVAFFFISNIWYLMGFPHTPTSHPPSLQLPKSRRWSKIWEHTATHLKTQVWFNFSSRRACCVWARGTARACRCSDLSVWKQKQAAIRHFLTPGFLFLLWWCHLLPHHLFSAIEGINLSDPTCSWRDYK